MNKIYRNWTVHNLVAHPMMELIRLISLGRLNQLGDWVHDVTLPPHEHED